MSTDFDDVFKVYNDSGIVRRGVNLGHIRSLQGAETIIKPIRYFTIHIKFIIDIECVDFKAAARLEDLRRAAGLSVSMESCFMSLEIASSFSCFLTVR